MKTTFPMLSDASRAIVAIPAKITILLPPLNTECSIEPNTPNI